MAKIKETVTSDTGGAYRIHTCFNANFKRNEERKMKKLSSILLTVAMAFTLSTTAFAATETTITTRVEPTYTVTIPVDTAIIYGETTTPIGNISISNVNFETGAGVEVTTQKTDLVNSRDNTKKIAYTLNNTTPKSDFTGVTFTSSDTSARPLCIDITSTDWNNAKAGDYSATLTFTIAYKTLNS